MVVSGEVGGMGTCPAVRFPCSSGWLMTDGGAKGNTAPRVISKIPKISIIAPPMMLRIAIIVTPSGRDLGVLCKV
jgi:hypothetical protein